MSDKIDRVKREIISFYYDEVKNLERKAKKLDLLRARIITFGSYIADGLEALAYAIRSDWNKESRGCKRQVIVVWSDSGTNELGFGNKSESYPNGTPKIFAELSEL